jgi:hypothetical protein
VHDLHIWPLSTTESALTAHLVFPGGHPGDEFLAVAASELRQRFGIGHTTLQIEISRANRLPPRARSCGVTRRPNAAMRATADRCEQSRLKHVRLRLMHNTPAH